MACACCDCEKPCRGSVSLEKWRSVMCMGPYPFYTMAQKQSAYPRTLIPLNQTTAPCNYMIYEHCHTECTVAGRDQICDAILQADKAFLDYMRYPPAPQQLCTEFYFGRGDHCLNVTGQKPFRGGVLQVDHFKVKQLGKETLTHLQTINFDAATQLSDANGDSLYDKATITIAKPLMDGTTTVSKDEIALFFVEDDRGQSRCCRWEIRDLAIKETATEFVVTVPAWVMAKPFVYDLWGQIDDDEFHVDPHNLTIYPAQLELYRRWVDTTQAVQVWRKPVQCGCSNSGSTECYECESATACILSSEQGLIDVNLSLSDCGCCPRCVDKICVSYIAGDCNREDLIAKLAASFLQADVCCSPTVIKYYAADFVAVSDRGAIMTPLSDAERATVFGTKRGGIEALRELRSKRKIRIGAL